MQMNPKSILICLCLFRKLTACNVSVAASGVIVCAGKSILWIKRGALAN